VYLCQNDYLNNKILKDEFGFKGIVISDWGATHNTVEAAMGGLDVEMGTRGTDYNNNFMGHPLRDSVIAGVVPEEIINDKAERILRVIYNTKKMDPSRKKGEFTTKRISNIAYDIASEAIVLLKNENKLLPLNQNKVKSIAVIGQNAVQPQSFGGATASVKAKYEISPLEGIRQKAGEKIKINYAPGYKPEFKAEENSHYKYPVHKPNQKLIDEAVETAKESEFVILIAGTNRDVETETRDRKDIMLPFGQDELIKAVTAANSNTIVVIVAGAACDLNVTKEYAPAILWSWYNGSEAGNALADVIFGDANPSGKLPFTVPKKLEDIGAHAIEGAYPGENLAVEYKEGILVGYRWFDSKNIEPLYPFGYGLSYTAFNYSGLNINKADDKINIDLMLENTGKAKGKEVVQCYIQDIECSVMRPEKELKAFTKVELKPGEKKTVSLSIKTEDLMFYDEDSGQWTLEPGEFKIMVGSSSRDIKLEGTLAVE
jgi:beta-glucosidase